MILQDRYGGPKTPVALSAQELQSMLTVFTVLVIGLYLYATGLWWIMFQ